MKQEMLWLQQYLNRHPLLHKDRQLRLRYVSLLQYFLKPQNDADLWERQLYKLYVQKLAGSGTQVGGAGLRDFQRLEKFKFFAYRSYLLTDCLFIAAFDDKRKGLAICAKLTRFWEKQRRKERLLGRRGRHSRKQALRRSKSHGKELSKLWEAFYADTGGGFAPSLLELGAIYGIIWHNRRFLKQPVRKVMITANMSAGKSTLLNALAGKKVNKTQNEACTAKIHYLYNKAGEDGLSYELDHDLELDASLDVLMTDNEANDSTEIIVGTRFRSLQEIEERVCLIDTPGVNSSMEQGHRGVAQAALQRADCHLLLYLFNGENIGSDDEFKHLRFVKENYKGRLIFLVNRVDQFQKDVDSVQETLAAVRRDLEKMGYVRPEVYPLSAYAAYLAKMNRYGEPLTEDEEDDRALFRRKLKQEEFSFEKYYPVQVGLDGQADQNAALLLHSGLLSLEQLIYG